MAGLNPGVQKKTLLKGRTWTYHIGLTLTALVIAFPHLYGMLISTQTNAEIFSFQLKPGSALGDHFQSVRFDRNFAQATMNSFQQAILVTVGKTMLSLLAGLAFVYFKFRFKWVMFFLVLITLMMPTEVMILAMLRQVAGYGWQDTTRAIVAVHRICYGCLPCSVSTSRTCRPTCSKRHRSMVHRLSSSSRRSLSRCRETSSSPCS